LAVLLVTGVTLRPLMAPTVSHASKVFTRCSPACARADFSGQWQMDLAGSDAIGPVLRELGINRVLAALVGRLSVRQEISQDDTCVSVSVRTAVSESAIDLQFDGSLTQTPGLSGGMSATVSRWLDEERLETRQRLDDAMVQPDDDCFLTVRSLRTDNVLQEEVAVLRNGKPVPGASATRVLRRVMAGA